MKYDFLIVGSGLFGAVFAHEMNKRNKKCLVLERQNHIGGNIYTENIEGINVHKYGAHIFHTSDEEVWNYINQFSEFNNFINSPMAIYKDEIYNLPFNMNTFSKMWNIKTPDEAKKIIEQQIMTIEVKEPQNLEEQAIKLVGVDIYEKLVKGYTEKQWGKKCNELPAFIIKRLPVRYTFNNNYFNDKYQGIPVGGYTKIVDKMLDGIEVLCNVDYFDYIKIAEHSFDKVVYTGPIDKFFNYSHGTLEYRSLRFETEVLDCDNYQGNAVINYTDVRVPYTRIIEHKHFENNVSPRTIITKEYPLKWDIGEEPYYTINDRKNTELYKKYKSLASKEPDVIFGGRLAEYCYYDMDKVIRSALDSVDLCIKKKG